VEITRADVLFRAVPVPAGQHRIEFAYAPLTLKVGIGISFTVFLGCWIIVWLGVRKHRTT
jgi:uncharacterized membrane protein YfhO